MNNLTTRAQNITRTQNHYYHMRASGLRPNTKHNIFIEGIDRGYSTRQFGKNFGEDLISDENGEIRYGVLYELEYNRDKNFEIPSKQQTDPNNQQGSKKPSRIFVENKIIELISPDGGSQCQFVLKLNIILTDNPVSAQFPIE